MVFQTNGSAQNSENNICDFVENNPDCSEKYNCVDCRHWRVLDLRIKL